MLKFNHGRGDTIIEVLFAITIFSLLVVGSLSIMNQGSAIAQRSLEISLVRNEIDAQAETLRFLNASYVAAYQPGAVPDLGSPAGEWHSLSNGSNIGRELVQEASSATAIAGRTCPDDGDNGGGKFFLMNTKQAMIKGDMSRAGLPYPADIYSFKKAATFAQVGYVNDPADSLPNVDNTITGGIWIEAVRPNIDLVNNQNNATYIDFYIRACWDSIGQSAPMTIGTIVRLYEPRG